MAQNEQTVQLMVFYKPSGFMADLSPVHAGRGAGGALREKTEALHRQWYEALLRNPWQGAYRLGFETDVGWMDPSVAYLAHVSSRLIRRLSTLPELELVRADVQLPLSEEDLRDLLAEAPFTIGSECIDAAWLTDAWERLLECFRREIAEYDGTVAAYFAEYNAGISVAGRVFFHLVESHREEYPFAFMATYSTKPEKSKRAIHTPLQNALLEFKQDTAKLLSLLSPVAKAADSSALIGALMESGELFSPLRFTADEAYTFLKEVPLYEAAGIMCRIPDWWRRRSNAVSLALTVGKKKSSQVGLNALVDFSANLMIDGEVVTEKELKAFMAMAEGLVLYKGKWVEVSHEKLQAALEALHRAKSLVKTEGMTLAEAMKLEMDIGAVTADKNQTPVTVRDGPWLQRLRELLARPADIDELAVEPTFQATLRPYQQQGYRWLNLMAELGFGACLADDMGLGKTVQMLAWLEHYRVSQGGHALLVVPASLLGNWQKEIARFAPQMSYRVLHASEGKGDLSSADDAFLTVTTYGMVSRQEDFAHHKWDILILDEAQAIKNPGTRQTKAAKAVPSRVRIAMTGTPIENSLGDLWSLFDFLNHGYLGSAKEFTDMVKAIEVQGQGFIPLKKMVSPFILRRLKTDKSIVSDLPDKVEIKEYPGLSQKQVKLYQRLVEDLESKLEGSEGIERKGLVLASLTKLKQICNHPDQYLGLDTYKKESSGKFAMLEELCRTIYDKRERVLIFTQFRELAEPLAQFLQTVFGRPGLVLHGGTAVKRRSEMVEAFNGDAYIPFMVLSLKAGGVGLNLTAANHVIHFDRWWNPATENQATDRAFRIGQTRKVIVHKFVTKGTIEEKIDAMIEDKLQLSGELLSGAGEKWITELDNAQLMDLMRLGGGKQ